MDPNRILTGPYTLKPLKQLNTSKCSKEEILDYFENAYSLNESLFTILSCEEAFYKCPDRLRLPLIFYYGHTAVVYLNKVTLAGLLQERVNFEFETMFETGVDEMNWDDTENYRMGGSYKWPSVNEVAEFRGKVRKLIRQVILDTPLELPVTQESPWWAVFMGLDHERTHIETSAVLIRQLPIDMVRNIEGWKLSPRTHEDGVNNKIAMVTVDASEVTLGKPVDYPTYGWDCEYPQVNKSVPAFEASAFLITNKQFFHFVNTRGYHRREWWTKEGWEWKTFREAKHPVFWVCTKGCKSNCGADLADYTHCKPKDSTNDDNTNGHSTNGVSHGDDAFERKHGRKYRYRTMCGEIAMPWDWPVIVNYHEAKAFCNWKKDDFRLPTEAEQWAMRDDEVPSDEMHNVNSAYDSSTPVNMYPPSQKGFYDVIGNAWEWVEDNFNGYPGFKSSYLYDDYAGSSMDGRHNIIVGGSWISKSGSMAHFSRYAFRRHFYQFAGFRLCRSVNFNEDPPVVLVPQINAKQDFTISLRNTDKHIQQSKNQQFLEERPEALQKRLQEEYGSMNEGNFYSRLHDICLDIVQAHNNSFNRVLDVGCACGRLAFELAKDFKEVVGLDFCEQYICASEQLKKKGHLSYHLLNEEDLDQPPPAKQARTNGEEMDEDAKIPSGVDVNRVTFKQMTWLPNELADYDLVIQHGLERVQNKKGLV
ncbi:uncharacterized protein [Amphiura filiformis]|uniref:uncharacterized protein isoform X2 n=1 Tax=Amphiura filiformis TaxID=82378 RepID=UPI003B213463